MNIDAQFVYGSTRPVSCEEKAGVCENITACDTATNIYKDYLCPRTTATRVCCIPRENVCTTVQGTCTADSTACFESGNFWSWFACDISGTERCCIPKTRTNIKVFRAPVGYEPGDSTVSFYNNAASSANYGGENKDVKTIQKIITPHLFPDHHGNNK